MWKPREDLTGRQFGRWTVLGQDEQRTSYWICQCNCEEQTIKSVYRDSLIKGKSESCGCLQREIVSKYNKKYNKYDLFGEYGIGWTSNTNQEFYFDLEDYDKIKDYCWDFNKDRGYISGADPTNWRKHRYIHRVIMECDNNNLFIDHINHNPLDNRKCNLRLVTPAQNGYNKGIQPYNTSGEIGVYFNNRRKKWIAHIIYNDKHYCVYCSSKEEAVIARRKLEDDLFKEYGYHNSIDIKETIQN